jgi:hypothetical protein
MNTTVPGTLLSLLTNAEGRTVIDISLSAVLDNPTNLLSDITVLEFAGRGPAARFKSASYSCDGVWSEPVAPPDRKKWVVSWKPEL